jgi:hypothetical protein
VWRYAPAEDLLLVELPALGSAADDYLRHFAFFDAGRGGFVLCGDNAKWMNHSDEANTAAVFEGKNPRVYDRDVAVRDIRVGEEITCDYRAFDRSVACEVTRAVQAEFSETRAKPVYGDRGAMGTGEDALPDSMSHPSPDDPHPELL